MRLFDHDDGLAVEISRVLCIAIDLGHGAISVATSAHQQAIDQHLENRGIDVIAARARGQYTSFDAAETLALISNDGVPDEQRFASVLRSIVESMTLRHVRVSIFGEMVALLWAEGQYAAAVQVEKWWNELISARPVLLYCAYPNEAAMDPAQAVAFRDVCVEHCKILESNGVDLPLVSR